MQASSFGLVLDNEDVWNMLDIMIFRETPKLVRGSVLSMDFLHD